MFLRNEVFRQYMNEQYVLPEPAAPETTVAPPTTIDDFDLQIVREGFHYHNIMLFSKKEHWCMQLGGNISDPLNLNAIQRYTGNEIFLRDIVLTGGQFFYKKRTYLDDFFYIPNHKIVHFLNMGLQHGTYQSITPYRVCTTRTLPVRIFYNKLPSQHITVNAEIPGILMIIENIPEVTPRLEEHAVECSVLILEMAYDPDILMQRAPSTGAIHRITTTHLSNMNALALIQELKKKKTKKRTFIIENVGPFNTIETIQELIKTVKDYNTTFYFRGEQL